MMNNRRFLIIVVILVILWIGIVFSRIYQARKPSTAKTSQPIQQQQTQPTEPSVSVSLLSESVSWSSGETYTLTANLNEPPEPFPTVFSIYLRFDPDVLKIDSVDQGDLWSSVNLLENEINNQAGELSYTLGQGFDAQVQGGTTLASINFTVKNTTERSTVVTLGPNSATAKSGVKTNITAQPLTIPLAP